MGVVCRCVHGVLQLQLLALHRVLCAQQCPRLSIRHDRVVDTRRTTSLCVMKNKMHLRKLVAADRSSEPTVAADRSSEATYVDMYQFPIRTPLPRNTTASRSGFVFVFFHGLSQASVRIASTPPSHSPAPHCAWLRCVVRDLFGLCAVIVLFILFVVTY